MDCEGGNTDTEAGELTFRSRKRPKAISGCLREIARSGAPGSEMFRTGDKKVNCEGVKANIDAGGLPFWSSGHCQQVPSCPRGIVREGGPGDEGFACGVEV